jgi:hypothetical protein
MLVLEHDDEKLGKDPQSAACGALPSRPTPSDLVAQFRQALNALNNWVIASEVDVANAAVDDCRCAQKARSQRRVHLVVTVIAAGQRNQCGQLGMSYACPGQSPRSFMGIQSAAPPRTNDDAVCVRDDGTNW